MAQAADIAAALVAAINLVAGCVGAWAWRREETPRGFWVLARAGQLGTTALAAVAGVAFLTGFDPSDDLFWLYMLLPIAVAIVAEQLRLAAAQSVLDANDLEDAQAVELLPEAEQLALVRAIMRRETGIAALAALVIVVLALRVLVTT